jgi:Flp pilus assembly protein TadD
MTLSPSDPLGYANLGLALARTGSPEAAIEPLERALALDPSLADAHFLLGSVYATLGRFSEASVEVERGLEFDPTNGAARQMLDQIRQQTTASLR